MEPGALQPLTPAVKTKAMQQYLSGHEHLPVEPLLGGEELTHGLAAGLRHGPDDCEEQVPEVAGAVVHDLELGIHLDLGNEKLCTLVGEGPTRRNKI